jgi:N-acetylneuraminate synthase/N,N'-diacetyllegionaminate synthase
MMNRLKIGSFEISSESSCYIIAEAGVNHNGNLKTALELVKKAKEAGADCVKFQTFRAASVITSKAPKAAYQVKVTDPNQTQYEMLRKLELSKNDFKEVVACCGDLGIQFLSTPYNKADADLLDSLGVDAFKVASGQIIEHSFLEFLASKKKPLILSTGMATLAEIDEAVRLIRGAGNNDLVVLQCTTNYPSRNNEANILAMKSIGEAFGVLTGYSDHVPNNYACYAAVSLGARVIEKHFTLDRKMQGPDHSSSLDVTQFAELVDAIRMIEQSLGSPVKKPSESEMKNAPGMRRSITAVVDIKKGDVLQQEMIDYKRPGTGLQPSFANLILNREARIDISADTQISLDMIKW